MNLSTSPLFWLTLLVYTSQLLVISLWVSHQWRTSRTTLLEKYPQKRFANLYVNPTEVEFKRLMVRKWLDNSAFIIGIIAMAVAISLNAPLKYLVNLVIGVAIIQLIPLAISARWCNQNSRAMAKRYPDKIRSAQLGGDSPLQLIPKGKVILVCSLFVISSVVGFQVSAYQEGVWLSNKTNQLLLLNLVLFVLMVSLMIRVMFASKRDHFADAQEIKQKQQTNVQSILNGLIAFNLFVLVIHLFKLSNIEPAYIVLSASVLVQSMIYTTRHQYLPINPKVYR